GVVDFGGMTRIEAIELQELETLKGTQVAAHVLDHHRRPAHDVIAGEQDPARQKTEMIVTVTGRIYDLQVGLANRNDRSFQQSQVWIEIRSRGVSVGRHS